MTFGSLFAGIGGIDLGLERAGMECQWQVEIDPFCRKVLAKHWPNVRRYEDVRKVGRANLAPVDLVAGGFPCQDVSVAGKRAGLKEGNRSGLWFEFHRIICELRPRYVFVENVPGLLVDGMGRVLGDLASSGYDAEWQVLSAEEVGANHLRERLWLVAYPNGHNGAVFQGTLATSPPVVQRGKEQLQPWTKVRGGSADRNGKHWVAEPPMGRVAYGIPRQLDRLRALGNAVVSQCAEWIGQRIMAAKTT